MCSFSYADSGTKKACYKVEGMTCRTCSLTLKTAINKLDGIIKVDASVNENSAMVEYNPQKTTIEAIGKKIDSAGYRSQVTECSQ